MHRDEAATSSLQVSTLAAQRHATRAASAFLPKKRKVLKNSEGLSSDSWWPSGLSSMTIAYDASALQGWIGLPRLFMRCSGTIIPGAVTGPLFWITNVCHVAILILAGRLPVFVHNAAGERVPLFSCEADDDGLMCFFFPSMPWSAATVGLGLLVFFTVFYSNNCFTRFFTLYSHCVGLGGATMEWVSLVKGYASRIHGVDDNQLSALMWNSTRHILASMHILYYSLNEDNMISEDEWRMCVARNLLSFREVAAIKAYKGFRPFLVLHWGLEEGRGLLKVWSTSDPSRHHDLGQGMRDELILGAFREVAFKFRGHCGQIVNTLKQPVPFPYFHLLNVILLSQLLLVAYGLATSLTPAISIPVMAFISAVLLGMRGLAVQLSNPFGTGSVDFELEAFLNGAYTNAVAHLSSDAHDPCGSALPDTMQNPLAVDGRPPAAVAKGRAARGQKARSDNGEPQMWGIRPDRVKEWPRRVGEAEQAQVTSIGRPPLDEEAGGASQAQPQRLPPPTATSKPPVVPERERRQAI